MIKIISTNSTLAILDNAAFMAISVETTEITLTQRRTDDYTSDWRARCIKSLSLMRLTDPQIRTIISGKFDHNPGALRRYCAYNNLNFHNIWQIIK